MGLPYWNCPSSPEKPYSPPPAAPRSRPPGRSVRRPYRSTVSGIPDPINERSPRDRITTLAEIEARIARYSPDGPASREGRERHARDVARARLPPGHPEAISSVQLINRMRQQLREMAEARALEHPEGSEEREAQMAEARRHAEPEDEDEVPISIPSPDSSRATMATGGPMESLGRYVARTRAQRQAAMEAARRAQRQSVGIESMDAAVAEDTPSSATVRDPLTWRTREDGSVIPPSMESSQTREQPQPILGGDGAMDFTSRAADLERTRRDLERRYETRLRHLRAAAPLIHHQTGDGTTVGLTRAQLDGIESGDLDIRAEIERVREETERIRTATRERRAALLQPGRRSISNLRRYLRRQPAPGSSLLPASPAEPSPANGLGDRERSLSPENDNAWDTLLTTISPDPQPPSTSSSFTSAATSAAASAGSSSFGARSQSSAATSIDVDIDSESGDGPSQFFENICETFESRIGSEDDREGVSAGEITGVEVEDPTLDIFWRGYTDVVTRRADRVARVASVGRGGSGVRLASTHPFGGMQRIVQRLATRQDIPDEWWATAGLARIVAREEQ